MGMSTEEFKQFGLKKDEKTGMYKKEKAEKPKAKPFSSFKGHIFIPGNVPSAKNSKRIFFKYGGSMNGKVKCTMNGKPASPFITDSLLTEKYRKETQADWLRYKSYFHELVKNMEPPYIVEFTFVRSSKRGFDFNNANHICTDLMATHGWVEDDNMDNVLPIPKLKGQSYYVSPKSPGVWITVKQINQ